MLDASYIWLDQHMQDRVWAVGNTFARADCAAVPSLFYVDLHAPYSRATLSCGMAICSAQPTPVKSQSCFSEVVNYARLTVSERRRVSRPENWHDA